MPCRADESLDRWKGRRWSRLLSEGTLHQRPSPAQLPSSFDDEESWGGRDCESAPNDAKLAWCWASQRRDLVVLSDWKLPVMPPVHPAVPSPALPSMDPSRLRPRKCLRHGTPDGVAAPSVGRCLCAVRDGLLSLSLSLALQILQIGALGKKIAVPLRRARPPLQHRARLHAPRELLPQRPSPRRGE